MRTFKSFCLSAMPCAVDMGHRHYLSLNVLAAFDVSEAAPKLLLEQNLWRFLPEAAPGYVESGKPRIRSEYLVFGHVHAPGAKPSAHCKAGVRFSGRTKAVEVWGPRRWDGRRVGDAEAFTTVPLSWAAAFGGANFAENPQGMGHSADDRPAAGLALPQLEDMGAPWSPKTKSNRSVGFGPIAIDNPLRTRYQGTYDANWLREHSPAPPPDFDWRFYQLAAEDQQFDQAFKGDETYEWHHLQPQAPVVRGVLPGIAAAAFIRRDGADSLEAVPTTLRSALFFPDRQRIVLVWQGVTKTADEEFSDISHLLVGAESLGQPKPAAHYERVFGERADREKGMLAALREDELLPASLHFEPLVDVAGVLSAEPAADSLAARTKRRAEARFAASRAEVAGYGMNPDEHAPPAQLPHRETPTEVKDLPAFFAQLRKEAEENKLAAQARLEASLATTERELAPLGYDGSLVRSEINAMPSGPPQPEAPARIQGIEALAAHAKGTGVEIGEIHEMAVDDALHANWRQADADQIAAYRRAAHRQPPASRAEKRHAERQRGWVRERLAAQQPLEGLDLTGADLRDFDLRGANLDRALLESAVLDGARLDGATLRGAVLAHANLRAASLVGCDFSEANLGRANLTNADATRANFEKAVLSEAVFTGADLRQAQLAEAQVLAVVFGGARLDGATLDGLVFDRCSFEGASLVGTSARMTVFMHTPLAKATLSGLQGRRVVFYGVQASGLKFDSAQLEGASFVEGTRLEKCSFRGANLARAMLRGAGLAACDFTGACLDGALLSHADLAGAQFLSASAIETNFMRADLSKADLRQANLRGALLTAALAHGTRLQGANLFASDLARIRIDTQTGFDGALMNKARLHPRAQP